MTEYPSTPGADQKGSSNSTSGSAGNSTTRSGTLGSRAQGVADQALSAGRDLKDKAADLAGQSAEAVKEHAAEFADAAKDLASQTSAKIEEKVNEQRGVGADYVGNLADTIRRAASEFDADLPFAANYIRKAASQVESASNTLREGNFGDLVQDVQAFAKRQPTAFLGLSVLAGFGVVRFLKSTSSPSSTGRHQAAQNRSREGFETPMRANRNTGTYGYRDEFSK